MLSSIGILLFASTGTDALTPILTIDGTLTGDHFGSSIAALRDLDHDGITELLIGAPNRQPSSLIGRAFVVSGKSGVTLRVHNGFNYGDRFGHSVAQLPDLDGDGTSDYCVGAIWSQVGAVYPGSFSLYSGATGGKITDAFGAADGECFGASAAALDDVNGDGVQDFVLGARFGGALAGDPTTAKGRLHAFSGKDGSTLFEVKGQQAGDWLGYVTIALPDLDGDGKREIATTSFGYPQTKKRGEVRVLSSASGALLFEVKGANDGDRFGAALSPAPDLNHDGTPDLLIGAPGVAQSRGQAVVVSGSDGALLFSLSGAKAGDGFGSAVSLLPDLDGDGVGEIVIGAPGVAGGLGQVSVVSAPHGGKVLAQLRGRQAGDAFGSTVSAIPDVSGDGGVDLAVGATDAPAGAGTGRVVLYAVK